MGHRERKKLKMREDLTEAAYQLFVKKGFDNTKIQDITDLVNVSSRTFFRYFTCKEDVVLDYELIEYDEIIEALASRPKHEPILTALRHAAVSVTRGCEEGAYGIDPDRFHTLRDLIKNHPLIRAKNSELLQSRKATLTLLIAQKMGVDPLHDSRPLMIATALAFVYSTADDVWQNREPSVTYCDVLDEIFALIETGFNYPCVDSSH